MTKLIAYLIPGLVLIGIFSIFKNLILSPDVTFTPGFVYLSVAFYLLCVVVPCVIYYLRTPPGIDHK